jgi:hypothetical protein
LEEKGEKRIERNEEKEWAEPENGSAIERERGQR